MRIFLLILLGASIPDFATAQVQQTGLAAPTVPEKITDALSAGPLSITAQASVVDWPRSRNEPQFTELRAGSNGWACLPTPVSLAAKGLRWPTCYDGEGMKWLRALLFKEEVRLDGMGMTYMLQGYPGASAIDPYASGPTPENEWVVGGQPELMVFVPDPKHLDHYPGKPGSGGPWVMWKGTPYAHLMVPVAKE